MFCQMYQWFLACRVDTRTSLGPWLDRHVRTCRACRAYYQTHLRVSDLLETQGPHVSVEGVQALKDTILVALPVHDATPVSVRRSSNRFRLALAASVFILVSATLTSLHMAARRQERLREQTFELASLVTLPRQWAPSELLATYGPFVQAPLETEVRNLATDARQAARFLVQCTPFARAESRERNK
jgi:hypothetical protein